MINMIKRLFYAAVIVVLAGGAFHGTFAADEPQSGYKMPAAEMIRAIVADPTRIADVLDGASAADVAAILINAIGVMTSMNMPQEAIAAKLNIMLDTVSDVRGKAFGAAVMARIRKKVIPRLLPVVPPPGMTSRYPRQSTAD